MDLFRVFCICFIVWVPQHICNPVMAYNRFSMIGGAGEGRGEEEESSKLMIHWPLHR